MNIADMEKELKKAGEGRLAALNNEKIVAAAVRGGEQVGNYEQTDAQMGKRAAASPPPCTEKNGGQGGRRGGIAVLNPFRYGAKGIAVFAAAILAVLGGVTALTIYLAGRAPAGGVSSYMIELLTDTEVEMDGVTAFGIVKSTDTVKTSALRNNEEEKKERKFDTTLVSFDANGGISEVVFRYTDGSGEVTQDEIGSADKIYVTTEFTYIQYSVPDDIYRDTAINNVSPIEIFFRCDDYSQSFAIHNESGKVYSLAMLGEKYVADVVGNNNEYDYIHLTVFDGAVKAFINYNNTNSWRNTNKYFKLNFDADFNLVAEDLMPNKSVVIDNIYRDVYGNLYVYNNISYDIGLNETNGNVKYFSDLMGSDVAYYYGSDRKVYLIKRSDRGYEVSVFDENLQIKALTELPDISLFDMSLSYKRGGNSYSQTVLIKNGYFFQITQGENFVTCHKHIGNGTFERMYIDSSAEAGYMVKSYLLDGELMAVVDKNGKRQLVHIDFSAYDEVERKVTVKEICDASYVTEPYGMLLKSIIIVHQTMSGTQRYQITYEDGEIRQTLLSDKKYGGQIVSIQPLN